MTSQINKKKDKMEFATIKINTKIFDVRRK